jgi:hypothetical protein
MNAGSLDPSGGETSCVSMAYIDVSQIVLWGMALRFRSGTISGRI